MTLARMTRWLPLASLVFALAGCPPTPPAGDDGGQDAGCAGQVGCECNAGTCTTGECIDGSCVDCRRGEAACICRANNTCNTGLRCATGRCESCPAGEMGCPCGTGDMCGTGLVCTNGTCVTDTCTAGADSCPCRAGDPKCDSALYCDSTTLCRACSNDVVGCPCVGGACTGQTVCDTGTSLCRAPVTCAGLRAANLCAANQACVEGSNVDAVCTPMTCEAGYKWNGTGCTQCIDPSCQNEPSCDPATDAGVALLSMCATQNKECVTVGSVSSCGPCKAGFAPNGSGVCKPVPLCDGVSCALDQYCESNGTRPRCLPLPCAAGFAKNTNDVCIDCTAINCSDPGYSNRIWPFTTQTNLCVCETLTGYFIPAGGTGTATACDADNDGWVNRLVSQPAIANDRALSPNARCDVRSTDRVRLFDEYGLSVDVLSCTEGLKKASLMLSDGGLPNGGIGLSADGGLVRQADGGTPGCTGIVPLRLFEPARNDVALQPSMAGYANYKYGRIEGRHPAPEELNALTKFCASTAADFNADGTQDIAEAQPLAPTDDEQRLEAFAYFGEIYTSTWENGVLVIREKNRCLDSFPLHYAVDGGAESYNYAMTLDAGGDMPYWRSCGRQRDPQYGVTANAPGFDFAQFACDATNGSCPAFQPAHPVLAGPVDEKRFLMRNHGLCRLGGSLPADGLWRGMSHHSQFKCVEVVAVGQKMQAYQRETTNFSVATEKLTFNDCYAAPCDGGTCTVPMGTGKQGSSPVVRCVGKAVPDVGWVGLAAVNYLPYRSGNVPVSGTYTIGQYQGGCVNEDDSLNPSSYLCPYPQYSLDKALSDSNWGRYSCYGMLQNFLWAADSYPGNLVPISTLYWAPNTGLPDGGSVLR